MRFVDLFAGLGGFHRALSDLGHECVFASEIDDELREAYIHNFREAAKLVHGDIRGVKDKVPSHDILCAGFPCQPFSKSGRQEGFLDATRGTLFHEVLEIVSKRLPKYVLLENVGNFERHDRGRTWAIVKSSLESVGYHVLGTEHVASGGHGLVSPHHLGHPHTRERFFIVASLKPLLKDPFPPRLKNRAVTLKDIEQSKSELSPEDLEETALPSHYVECIEHWNCFLRAIPPDLPLPSFPIWGDELSATYPFRTKTPYQAAHERGVRVSRGWGEHLPPYARTEEDQFPPWKIEFIAQNRAWFRQVERYLSTSWRSTLRSMPPSLRKLEWNCQGEPRDLWRLVLQFRPSGLRAKRYNSSPALISMTTSQIPILGPKRRFITRVEGLRLQGFPDSHRLPARQSRAFHALGNAVHVGVVRDIASRALEGSSRDGPA